MHEQINYVLDENELIKKGLNDIFSLVFDEIKQLNKDKKHFKITYNNTSRQNKNNITF